ncbi:hypothetical protein Pmani_004355 [Petrolisthes manimaculis]|uniref:Uncharacterized protein n=1 Tax=Petrolisthes manimaculis TaxID=1843537 RepID=A0AAE1QF32_9EUCA|nr:hypothetical protein Pmani_004355 [Petrolisthes manimaculis]
MPTPPLCTFVLPSLTNTAHETLSGRSSIISPSVNRTLKSLQATQPDLGYKYLTTTSAYYTYPLLLQLPRCSSLPSPSIATPSNPQHTPSPSTITYKPPPPNDVTPTTPPLSPITIDLKNINQ